jgi:ABC-type transport system involved in multi-copper enzyme maturation permease subunit
LFTAETFHNKAAPGRRTPKMKDPFSSPFAAVFHNEVRLNSRRIAPYLIALLCAGNGLLWWGWGPGLGRGWAVNSDAFIAGALPVYSFMMLPLFTAVIMADPVIRDFRFEIDPLIFSKPISRAEYLLGKFFGSFFVLACAQSAFVVMWFVLQAVPKRGIVSHGVTLIPYIKHFLVFVVITHLTFAAFYFTVGTLTRNSKIVYGLGVLFYPLIATYNIVLLNHLPVRWGGVLDPLLMRWEKMEHSNPAEYINNHIVVYDADLIVNRAAMILIAAICLTILYRRFATDRAGDVEKFSVLNLSTAEARAYYNPESLLVTGADPLDVRDDNRREALPLPKSAKAIGARANIDKLIGAVAIELQLLRAERGLIVLVPLIIFFCTLELAFYKVVPEISYSATYASSTTNTLLFFLVGIIVFYTGEAMHRERELKILPVLWSSPIPNSVLLLSKYLSTILLTLSLILVVGLLALMIQLLRGHTPIDLSAYLITYSVVLVPSVVFITAFVMALDVLLRNKYLAYVVAVGTGAGLFYLYNLGYNHWSYNPLLYRAWKYADLTSTTILVHRLYWLGLAAVCLAVAHVFFERKS